MTGQRLLLILNYIPLNKGKTAMSKLPIKDCIINNYFVGTDNPEFWRLKYCKENCNYKCINQKPYKKIKENTTNAKLQ